MNSTQSLVTVRKLFDAVARRDVPTLLSAYGPDVVIHEAASLPYGREFRGRDGALRHAIGFASTWDRYQQQISRDLEPEFVAFGDRAVVVWRFRVQRRERESLDLPAVSIYRLRDAQIIESRMFHFDTAALLQFLRKADPCQADDPGAPGRTAP